MGENLFRKTSPSFSVRSLRFHAIGDRAFLGQQRAGAVLEGDRAEIGVIDPLFPLAQVPDAAGHHDRRFFQPEAVHHLAERQHAGERVLRALRVLAVGQAVVAARQPGVFVDHAAEIVGEPVVSPLPQRAEGSRRRHDRVVVDAVADRDLRHLVGHAGAAGDAVDQALGAFQDAVKDALRRPHLPQDVHVDAALAAGDLVRDPGLRDAAGDRVADKLLVPLAPRLAAINLIDDVTVVIEAVGVHAGKCADPTSRCPGAGTLAVGHGDAFTAFDQRQDLTTRDQQRLERLQRTLQKLLHCVHWA